MGLLWAAAFTAAAHPADAQLFAQAVPVKYSLTVRPGEPVARDVMISNLGDAPVVVRLRFSDWAMSDRGELSLLPPGTTPNSLAGCVQVDPEEFSLQPGEEGRIHLTMTLPEGGPATRWGVVLSEVLPVLARSPKLGPRAIAELGTTLYLSRIPADHIRPRLDGLEVTGVGGDSMAVRVSIRNLGERHLYAGGEIAVTDSAGTQVAGGRLATGVVLPMRMRVFSWACKAGLRPGRYTVTATLDTGEPELTVGETRIQWPITESLEAHAVQQRSSSLPSWR